MNREEIKRKKIIQQAIEACQLPDFLTDNRPVYSLAVIGKNIYHFISVALAILAIGFVAYSFTGLSSDSNILLKSATVLLALFLMILVAFLEIGKLKASDDFFRSMNVASKGKTRSVIILVILCFLSISLSSAGAFFASESLSDHSDDTIIRYEQKSEELKSVASSRIEKLEEEIRHFESSPSYKKANWVWNREIQKSINEPTLSSLAMEEVKERNDQIRNITRQLDNDLVELKKKSFHEISSDKQTAMIYAIASAGIILILELLTLVAYNYKWFYLSQVYFLSNGGKEKNDLNDFETVKRQIDDVKKKYEGVKNEIDTLTKAESLPLNQERKIGFQVPDKKYIDIVNLKSDSYVDAVKNGIDNCQMPVKEFDGWQKRPDLCSAIVKRHEGEIDMTNTALAKEHDVSRGTVINYEKALYPDS